VVKPFLHEDFLLDTEAARRLYHGWAAGEPIFDFHSHLPAEEIADDTAHRDLAVLWLGGDHYKWRQMRANGVPEALITGRRPDREVFRAWAATVPRLLGNPLYHWTHLELRRYFGVEELLDGDSADRIYDRVNEQLAGPGFSAQALLAKMGVRAVCTTDDPADDLGAHRRHRGPCVLAPTFRPDKALAVGQPGWREALARLGSAAGLEIRTLGDLKQALDRRHRVFHEAGCRLSDHAMTVPPVPSATWVADQTFDALWDGRAVDPAAAEALTAELLADVATLNSDRGWSMQLHIGALRNINTPAFDRLGPDSGHDAISDAPIGRATALLLDHFAGRNGLPRTILYPLNPGAHDTLASILGAFQDGTAAGKVQLGAAWWFNDHIDGMDRQLRTLANLGLLSRFVGMLTDSRSLLSFPRHEYFRRVLCRRVGRWMDDGLVPGDEALVGGMVKDLCYRNAVAYFRLPGPPSAETATGR
jgi:glucuronate isomerase